MTTLWFNILCVGIAGAAGALSRWGISQAMYHFLGSKVSQWPWTTLIVNVLGCFFFGLLFELFRRYDHPPEHPFRLIFLIGFMGSFTTFSTFAFETNAMNENQGPLWAGLNIALQVGLGWFALVIGMMAAKIGS